MEVRKFDVRWETYQLFKWYTTLILLSLFGYKGKYKNRLTPTKLGEFDWVPWAEPTSDDDDEQEVD